MKTRRLPIVVALAALAAVPAAAQVKFNSTQFVVVGEGLAAGMADFGLKSVYQEKTFGAQMAKQMKTLFPQPLIEGAGIGNVPGYTQLPVRLPGTLQGGVRDPFPPYLFVFNLSIPGQKVADVLTRRPSSPLVQPRDPQQTVINMILGFPALIVGKDKPLWTQGQYAALMNPTFAIVELGYFDVLEPAVKDDPTLLPDVTTFRTNFTAVLKTIRETNAEMIVMTIPDPFDTPYFNTLANVTRLVGTPESALMAIFKMKQDDFITPYGLAIIGNLILSKNVSAFNNPLYNSFGGFFPGAAVSMATRNAVRTRLTALNTEVVNAAKAVGANVYDLAGFYSRIKAQGVTINGRTLTADYLGGFYSLNQYYPGAVGHGLIANELLTQINQTYQQSFPLVDMVKVLADDPAARFTPASRKPINAEELQ